jgi:DNA polymerase II large subunit
MKVFVLVLPKNNYPAASFYEKEISNFKFTKHIGVVSLETIAVREHDQDGEKPASIKVYATSTIVRCLEEN